jgi:hypothetical protein
MVSKNKQFDSLLCAAIRQRIFMTLFIFIPLFVYVNCAVDKSPNENAILPKNSYFINSQNGNDDNNGLSINTPWKSHTMVESVNLQPGDSVCFARGSSWSGGIQINASGSEGNPIIFTNYGSGNFL